MAGLKFELLHGVPYPHGGLQPLHQKSTYPYAMNRAASCGKNLVTYYPGIGGGRNLGSAPCGVTLISQAHRNIISRPCGMALSDIGPEM